MSEVLSLALYRQRVRPAPVGAASKTHHVFFERAELNHILSLYSRRVIAGEWCDYGIELEQDAAAFAVYRRASDAPLYRIVKRARAARRSCRYLVLGGGRILKYGRSLARVLEVLERKRLRAVDST